MKNGAFHCVPGDLCGKRSCCLPEQVPGRGIFVLHVDHGLHDQDGSELLDLEGLDDPRLDQFEQGHERADHLGLAGALIKEVREQQAVRGLEAGQDLPKTPTR